MLEAAEDPSLGGSELSGESEDSDGFAPGVFHSTRETWGHGKTG